MRAELLDRYRALALPTTRDEHWRFTDLRGFDPSSSGAAMSNGAVRPALDLDVAGRALVTENGIEILSAPDGVRFEPHIRPSRRWGARKKAAIKKQNPGRHVPTTVDGTCLPTADGTCLPHNGQSGNDVTPIQAS